MTSALNDFSTWNFSSNHSRPTNTCVDCKALNVLRIMLRCAIRVHHVRDDRVCPYNCNENKHHALQKRKDALDVVSLNRYSTYVETSGIVWDWMHNQWFGSIVIGLRCWAQMFCEMENTIDSSLSYMPPQRHYVIVTSRRSHLQRRSFLPLTFRPLLLRLRDAECR